MRLRDINKLLDETVPIIQNMSIRNEAGSLVVSNFVAAFEAIKRLENIEFLTEEISVFKSMPELYNNISSEDFFRIGSKQYEALREAVNNVVEKRKLVTRLTNQSLGEESENSINVKLPNYDELDKIIKFFQDLNNIFTMTIMDERVGGKVEVEAFESGSLWITISVGTTAALTLLSQIVNAALKLKNNHYETEKVKMHTQAIGVSVDFMKHLEAQISEQANLLTASYAKEILESNEDIKNSNKEYVGRLEQSLKTMSRLLFEGAEIHKTLTSSNVNVSFPIYNQLETREGLKNLEDQKKLLPSYEIKSESEE